LIGGGVHDEFCEFCPVGGEDVVADECHFFHGGVVAFVHGAFESEDDESVGEFFFIFAVVQEGFEVALDHVVDVLDGEQLFQQQVLLLQDLGEGERFELLLHFVVQDHFEL
jgi:hypothetical protein